jgi:hypothetical protein
MRKQRTLGIRHFSLLTISSSTRLRCHAHFDTKLTMDVELANHPADPSDDLQALSHNKKTEKGKAYDGRN